MEINEKIRVLERQDREYPRRLREIPGPPKRLYVLGKLPEEQIPTVAVIGARDCSEYGKYVASGLGAALGRSGIQVVSGMARGVDGISQEAALDAGGSSFAVLGSGVDICYPAGNRQLYEKLKLTGGILSEYPPGTPPVSRHFPPRNRIVSGLSDAVVVVEAREKSGTLITVDMALEQGREVYVVPGRVTDPLSGGCNRLLKLGAGLLLNREEFIEELWEICERKGLCGVRGADHGSRESRDTEALGLTEAQRALLAERPELLTVYGALDFTPGSVEQIREKLPEEYGGTQISVHLIRLCMEKLAVQVSPGQFCLAGGTVQEGCGSTLNQASL
ncbi:MAG: DNA-processing protein DprA [Firmicutes bacterium]|nr:DNA-processing protein DprA [Bacillota bacterium]